MTTLNELRDALTTEQRNIVNAIWRYQRERNTGMPHIELAKNLHIDEKTLGERLKGLSSDIIYSSSNSQVLNRYSLTYLGCLLAEKGEELVDLLARYLQYVQKELRSNPELESIELEAAMVDAGFSNEQSSFFKEMFYKTPFHGYGSPAQLPPDIDEWYSFENIADLRAYIEEKAMKNYGVIAADVIGGTELIIQNYFGGDRGVVPTEIEDSLLRFRADYPDPSQVSFVIMRFAKTPLHQEIFQSIQDALTQVGMTAVRADEKQYHDEVFSNIVTYIYGCDSAIAVFERIEEDNFNPNISLEVGYVLALKKHLCLLKDRTLKALNTDLIGRLYKEFDPQNPHQTISRQLSQWLRDKGLGISQGPASDC